MKEKKISPSEKLPFLKVWRPQRKGAIKVLERVFNQSALYTSALDYST